jgi:hypothetical protein
MLDIDLDLACVPALFDHAKLIVLALLPRCCSRAHAVGR